MISAERVFNLNIAGETLLPTPNDIKAKLPLTAEAERDVLDSREMIKRILDGDDERLFVVVGPCSIHDREAAWEYAQRLGALAKRVEARLLLVMRVYFEKPRSSIGWKGFINDPHLDDSFRIDEGLFLARQLLLRLAEMGIPAATEALDPLVPQYLSDLISWYAIGARTTESQTHREMASGLSAPVGFKNGTDGNLDVAVGALKSAALPHHFLGVTQDGRSAIFRTRGNPYGHVVLRGGGSPNYDLASIETASTRLRQAGLTERMVVDCSHGNSSKDYTKQPAVLRSCIDQVANGDRRIVGLMLESNLHAGRQELTADLSQLKYGVSVTDACLDWETTEELLLEAYAKLSGDAVGKS